MLGLVTSIDGYLFLIDKKQPINIIKSLKAIKKQLKGTKNEFLVSEEKIDEYSLAIDSLCETYTEHDDYAAVIDLMTNIKEYLEKVENATKPNFFTLGYYRYKNKESDISSYSIEELNKMTRKYIDDDFMLHFLEKQLKLWNIVMQMLLN